MSIAAKVRDHDAAGFGLPPVVVERLAEGVHAPHDRLRIERLADAREEPQGGTGDAAWPPPPELHQHADRRRRRVPDGDVFRLQNGIPALGVEVRFVDDAREPVRERRDDAVRRAGDPARIGRAPEHIVRMEVEREARRRVMGDDGLMHVHRAFRLAGRPAREVEQRRILGIRCGNGEAAIGVRHQRAQMADA